MDAKEIINKGKGTINGYQKKGALLKNARSPPKRVFIITETSREK